jgi:hypothetical protein
MTISTVSNAGSKAITPANSKAANAAAFNIQLANTVAINTTAPLETGLDFALLKVQAESAVWQAANQPAAQKVESIYDISPDDLESLLWQASQASAAINTAGLKRGEIYNRIEAVFAEIFGKDFLEPVRLTYSVDRSGPIVAVSYEASLSFDRALRNHGIGGQWESEVLIEARGYAGLTKDEMRKAVRAQYPEVMTLRDSLNMAVELRHLDLENFYYNVAIIDRIMLTLGAGAPFAYTLSEHEREYIWESAEKILKAMLDLPVDFEVMKASYDSWAKSGSSTRFSANVNEIYEKLLLWIGGDRMFDTEMKDELIEMLREIEHIQRKLYDAAGKG